MKSKKSKQSKKCKHDKCKRKAESNGYCKRCIQLPTKECNFCSNDKLINECIERREHMTTEKKPKQFNINTWWKKTLAVVAIGAMGYVGILVAAALLVSIMNWTLTISILGDPLAAIIQALLSGGIVYFCYRGIRRLTRDWGKGKKLTYMKLKDIFRCKLPKEVGEIKAPKELFEK